MPGLRETLEAATPGPWSVHPEIARGSHGLIRGADGKTVAHQTRSTEVATLIALTPELAALCIEEAERNPEFAARLDQLGKEQR